MRAGAARLRKKATAPHVRALKVCALLGNFLHGEGFDDVAFFDVVELFDGQAALVPGHDLLHGVLEPLQRGQHALVNYDAVAHQTHLAVLALELAILDIAARHGAHAGNLVGLAHLGMVASVLEAAVLSVGM